MQARIKKELKDFQKKKNDGAGVEAEVVGKDMQHWVGRLKGPEDTPYAGGIFTVDIKIPDQYPFAPPKVTFNTRLWHPNVSSQTGAICLDILKDQWSPAMTIRTVLLSLQALLCAAEPDDPQDAQVAQQYKKDRKAFDKQAAEWTKKYAAKGLSIKEQETKIKKLMEMGIKRDHARAELAKHGWDTEAAINAYFGN